MLSSSNDGKLSKNNWIGSFGPVALNSMRVNVVNCLNRDQQGAARITVMLDGPYIVSRFTCGHGANEVSKNWNRDSV